MPSKGAWAVDLLAQAEAAWPTDAPERHTSLTLTGETLVLTTWNNGAWHTWHLDARDLERDPEVIVDEIAMLMQTKGT